jgi:hypothetical protein
MQKPAEAGWAYQAVIASPAEFASSIHEDSFTTKRRKAGYFQVWQNCFTTIAYQRPFRRSVQPVFGQEVL